jgi:hypothetical protein
MNAEAKSPQDLKRDAVAAWRRFFARVESLLPDQAAPLWREAQTQAAAVLRATRCQLKREPVAEAAPNCRNA